MPTEITDRQPGRTWRGSARFSGVRSSQAMVPWCPCWSHSVRRSKRRRRNGDWVGGDCSPPGSAVPCSSETGATPTASNPNARASCLMTSARDMEDRWTDYPDVHMNRTLNLAEQWTDWHWPHVPVILVFQLVSFSSNRHWSRPPFEIVVHGCVVPGIMAT